LNRVRDRKGVSVVLGGMSHIPRTDGRVRGVLFRRRGKVTAEDSRIMDGVTGRFRCRVKASSTACACSLPCPSGTDISKNQDFLNRHCLFDSEETRERSDFFRKTMVPAEAAATLGASCGERPEKCPRDLEIPGCLEKAGGFCRAPAAP
jgi:predicted aldo/keto reductase-like oxidoreductase